MNKMEMLAGGKLTAVRFTIKEPITVYLTDTNKISGRTNEFCVVTTEPDERGLL